MLPGGYYPQVGYPAYPQPYVQAPLPAAPAAPVARAAGPAPKVRAKAPDEPKGLKIPTPEQLGLAPATSASTDWNATRGRLRQLKALCYQLDRVSAGGYKFTCWLPAEQEGKSYRVEAEAAGEAEAVRLCLDRADRWVRRTP